MDAKAIEQIVSEVLQKMGGSKSTTDAQVKKTPVATPKPTAVQVPSVVRSARKGVFADADQAARAARESFHQLRSKGFEGRAKVIDLVKEICRTNAKEWGRVELEETKIGRLDHKIEKLHAVGSVPGVEWIRPYGMSGDHGISMEENSPFGVIAAITPVTHSIPTLACNVINMVAAGNSIVVNAHPGGAKCAAMAVDVFNRAIEKELGISNLITIIEEPTLESFEAICKSPMVDLICVTGGPGVVKAAMASGKRAVCAGPGNPPVVVDVTADLHKAASDIIAGAAYDNNLLCIGEKQVFVLDAVYTDFLKAMERAGAHKLTSSQLSALTSEAFTDSKDAGGCSHPVLNRDLVGADTSVLAQRAGFTLTGNSPLLFAETESDHAFVQEEQMMPMVPVVRVRDIDEAIRLAKDSEHNYRHSAMIHTMHVGHMTRMGTELESTVFVKNGPCMAGLGLGGEGYISFSIATTTGEGITTPMTFTRRRRCVLVDALNVG